MVFMRQRPGILPLSCVFVKALLRPVLRPQVRQLCEPRRFRSTLGVRATTAREPVPGPVIEPVETQGIVLRDYQEACIQAVLEYLQNGHRRLGISLATGAGKTVRITFKRKDSLLTACKVIFTQLISRIPPRSEGGDKTLILVHRRELVEQAARHCRLAYPDKSVEIEMANNVATSTADIIIASVQTLVRGGRINRFAPNMFKLVLVDEAHHIVAKTYREVLEHFGLNEATSDSPVLVGVSATFSRSDGLKLGAAIDHIVYHKDYVDMIDDKWLANAMFTTVRSGADLSKVKKDTFGDFALGSLSEAVNTTASNTVTVRAWMGNAQDRKSTLVFCVDIAHTQALTNTFREYGIDARYVTSNTPRDVRSEQLQAFKDQEFPVLLNCGLFTEGTDIPNIDCVLLARPTKSRNLLIQMIGRGLRLFPGKENCHIIDMVASLETGVLSTPTLFGLHPDEVLHKATSTQMREEGEAKEEDSIKEMPPEEITNAAVNDDIKVKFTHYDTISDLIGDMRTGDRHIRTLSHYAWVRTGDEDDRYVLSDATGWLTIRKGSEDTDTDTDTSTYTDTSDTPTDHTNIYTVTHVRKIQPRSDHEGDDDDPITARRKEKPIFTRPRLIAKAPNLETAVRAADTYAPTVLREQYISLRQGWRQASASNAQLAMLNRAQLKRRGKLKITDVTRGQAADMITKLKFGGKTRFADMKKKRAKMEGVRAEMEKTRKMGITGVKVGRVT